MVAMLLLNLSNVIPGILSLFGSMHQLPPETKHNTNNSNIIIIAGTQ
jgi:hypothetical protein